MGYPQRGSPPPPPRGGRGVVPLYVNYFLLSREKIVWCFMKVQTKRLNRNVKPFVKNPVADSLCTPFHTFPSLREKLNESQFSTCNSIKSKRPPTHSFVGSGVWHLPSAETNHATVVFFLVDKQVLCGTENLVDSLIAVFTDVGDTFKRSKNFADHIFYK